MKDGKLHFKDFVKIILDYKLLQHEIFLFEFSEIFKKID